jgi:uncharacterized membrane protein HdeD (DUF308 family)
MDPMDPREPIERHPAEPLDPMERMEREPAADRGLPLAEAVDLARRSWWIVLVLGIAFLVAGIVMLLDLFVALNVLAAVFAAWLIVEGIGDILSAGRGGTSRVPGVVLGILGIVGGLIVAFYPGLGLSALALLFAILFIAVGLVRIVVVWRFDFPGEAWVLTLGVLQLLAGIGAILFREETVYVLAIVLGLYAIVAGLLQIAVAMRLRELPRAT